MCTENDKEWNALDDAEGYMKVAASLLIIAVIGVIVIINMLTHDIGNIDRIIVMSWFSGVFAVAAGILNHNAGVILTEYEAHEKANAGINEEDESAEDTNSEDKTDYSVRVID